jgi:hypothetical protein
MVSYLSLLVLKVAVPEVEFAGTVTVATVVEEEEVVGTEAVEEEEVEMVVV